MTDAHIAARTIHGSIGVLTIDSPPVNALSVGVRRAIVDGVKNLVENPAVEAIVLVCAGHTFFAGADIAEFGRPFEAPDLNDVIATIESSQVPVIAAIHGTALGGGLEVALGAHYRIALADAKFGFPEVTLGLLPGAGGTQRLPRLCGAQRAFELMLTGKPIDAAEALQLGIVDRVAGGRDLQAAALDYAAELVKQGAKLRRIRDIVPALDHAAFSEMRKQASISPLSAPKAMADAVVAAFELPFDQGLAYERRRFEELMSGSQSIALRHLFFAEREARKIADLPAETAPRGIGSVGVIGAGTMGGGIAMNFLNVGIPVVLVEAKQDALDRGVATIRRNYEATARKGRITTEQVEQRMALLSATLNWGALRPVDLVIEAVFESMALKKEVLTRLDEIVASTAIVASNTSFLDLNEIAAATTRPERVIGLHFFSPANVMRLLEVVRGSRTAPEVLLTAMQLARRIGKLAVVSGVCNGFIANRTMDMRRRQAERLLLEGVSPMRIDELLVQFGFPMGQFAMMDLVGLDVMGRDSTERTLMSDFVAAGRLGQKQGGGYFDYDDRRRASPSTVAAELIQNFARTQGIGQRNVEDEEILARILYPVVNEGSRLLQEGIASRASDIDVALVAGYGWPAQTGGPMHWGERVGFANIVQELDRFADGEEDFEASAWLRAASQGRRAADLVVSENE